MSDIDIGDSPIKPEPEPDKEERIVRYIAKIVVVIIAIVVVSISSCTMHSNIFDGERLREEVKIIEQETLATQAKYAAEQAKTRTVKELIDSGTNPIAARCAVFGWVDKESNTACTIAGK